MPGADFTETFAALRDVLKKHSRNLLVTADTPTDFTVASRDKTDRTGRPLFIAGVQIRKSYVTYHLLPIYMNPALMKSVPPLLKKRMQGKACFNFSTLDPARVNELSALTKTAIAKFRDVKLPWDKPAKK